MKYHPPDNFQMNMPRIQAGSGIAVRVLVLALITVLALFIGIGGALAGWFGQIVLLSVAIPVVLLMLDPRIGLTGLILLMPLAGAQFIPKAGPLSLVNVLLLGVCSAFVIRIILLRINGRHYPIVIPKPFVLLFLIPLTIGFLNGSVHLGEIPNYMNLRNDGVITSQSYYWISLYFKNLLMVAAVFIVASVILENRGGIGFIRAYVIAGCLLFLVGVAFFLLSGRSLDQAIYSRQMFSALGRHANSIAGMFLPVLAVSLFMRRESPTRTGRLMLLLAASILFMGTILTGSRGGFIGMLVVIGGYLWMSRSFKAALLTVFLFAAALFVVPDAALDRLTMGVSGLSANSSSVDAKGDELTSGRLWVYGQLLPDLARSPLIGNGITSTFWSTLVKGGYVLGQPHNLYLAIALDLGLMGIVCMSLFGLYVVRLFRGLAADERLGGTERAFFSGCLVGFFGYLTWGLSTGEIQPLIEQWFVWLGIGIAAGYRRLLDGQPAAPARASTTAEDSRLHTMPWRPT